LAFSRGFIVTEEQVESVLKQIQRFDPAGVGARNLQECLLIQLRRKAEPNPSTGLAIKILEDQFDAFTKKHYEKLMRSLNVDEAALKEAIDEILRLNPKPGGASSGTISTQQVIIPD